MSTLVAPNAESPPNTLGLPLTDDEEESSENHEAEILQQQQLSSSAGPMIHAASSTDTTAENSSSEHDLTTRRLRRPSSDDSISLFQNELEHADVTPKGHNRGPVLQQSATADMTPSPTLQAASSSLTQSPASAPPLPPLPFGEGSDNHETLLPKSQTNLEDRVSELEAKLSTLTILLQAATKKPSLAHSPMVTRSVSPTNHGEVCLSPPTSFSPPTIPPLESPYSLGPMHRKRLSEVLLCEDSSSPSTPKGNHKATTMTTKSNRDLLLNESSPSLPKLLSQPILQEQSSSVSQENNQDSKKTQWLDFLNSFQESNADVDLQMEEFVRVPSKVEQLLGFGLWICVDCFLYILTILPVRFVWSCLLGMLTIMGIGDPNGPYRFHRRHLYQVIQVSIIFIVYNYVLCNISIGKLYHWIRGQVMLKLYLLIAIVEVFDRLMCSLGQDCLDSLYWNTTRRPHSKRMLVSMSVVLVYAMVHTLLLFVHVATLNVAMNSADQALLSLLIGGNFAEIKSTVFKKYNKQHLFKITASDICERFKLALFLTLVLILNLFQGMDRRMVYDFCYMCGIVWVAELLSDWVKHSFITKFNYIKSSVYPEYSLLLAGDVTGIGHEEVNLDHSHAVVKRIGLAQIPLVCVMFRYLTEAARYAAPLYEDWSRTTVGLTILAVWCVLALVKYFSGSMLLKVASKKLEDAPHVVSSAKKRTPKKKSV